MSHQSESIYIICDFGLEIGLKLYLGATFGY